MIDVIHFYRVENLDHVRRFYGDIMRLPLYKEQETCLIYCMNGHGKIGFCTHHPVEKNSASCITFVYSSVVDVDSMFSYLDEQLDDLKEPVFNKRFKIYHFFAKDFEGLTVEFQAFL